MKTTAIFIILILSAITSFAQNKQESTLKREVTLYNPYKPVVNDAVKISSLPDMTDTAKVRPVFKYEVKTYPFMPPYVISPVRAATMLPDPLPKLYNSYVKFGFGNYVTPLAEISVTNQRSKKGNIGVYAHHFSTNGKVELQNLRKGFAGYMDNDLSVYGRKFFRTSILSGSVDLDQKTRYAYGYDTSFVNYEPDKKDIKLTYNNVGANIGLKSDRLDSTHLVYDIKAAYNFFSTERHYNQHNFNLSGELGESRKDFYIGSGFGFDVYQSPDSISSGSKYLAAINPFLRRGTGEWNVSLGFQALLDKEFAEPVKLHIYPNLRFGFNIVPAYIGFFAELSGYMEKNDPLHVIDYNPFILPGKTLYMIPNTDYTLVVKAGLSGATGINGNYQVFGSYSIINNMLLFANYVLTDSAIVYNRGNYFIPLTDEAEVLKVHGDFSGDITDKVSFKAVANFYRYTVTDNNYAWNKPDWDATLSIRYNLRDKILAGIEANAIGRRKLLVMSQDYKSLDIFSDIIDMPAYLNFNLSAEYRYTKILSFWIKFNNIGSRFYEWAYYPSQRFICLVGFTYSM
jgi:hypothetical protein